MELYQLKTFLVIARTGNLTRAATELHASQPTVSGQLKALEEELNVVLFERTPRGMVLTEAGQRLRDKAQEVTDSVAEFTLLAASLTQNSPLCCKVGVNTTATALRIAELVGVLATIAPQLRLELHHGQSHKILDDIARGTLDVGFFFGRCDPSKLNSSKLLDVSLAVVGPEAWQPELANASWVVLLEKPWVMPPETCPFYEVTLQLQRSTSKRQSHSISADDESTMLELVRAEAGVALLPASMVEGQNGVTILRHTQTTLELAFAWSITQGDAPHIRPVRTALERIWGDVRSFTDSKCSTSG
jgi:DNA-binding transcriptional LysR family regulator